MNFGISLRLPAADLFGNLFGTVRVFLEILLKNASLLFRYRISLCEKLKSMSNDLAGIDEAFLCLSPLDCLLLIRNACKVFGPAQNHVDSAAETRFVTVYLLNWF